MLAPNGNPAKSLSPRVPSRGPIIQIRRRAFDTARAESSLTRRGFPTAKCVVAQSLGEVERMAGSLRNLRRAGSAHTDITLWLRAKAEMDRRAA
jgi:hypothetical protein